MAVRLNVSNNGQTTLVSAMTLAATSFTVTDTSTFPPVPFRITIDAEIMEVGTVNATTKVFSNVLRAQEGTTAATHNAGSVIENRWTAGTYNELVAAINEARTYAP